MLENSFFYIIIAFLISMLWAPGLIHLLYRYNVTRRLSKDFSALIGNRQQKDGTPIMGGLLIVVTVTIITLLTNWNRWTYIPIFTLLVSAFLGGADDLLNIFGRKRVIRTVKKQLVLARVHKSILHRVWLWFTLPWSLYQNFWYMIGSYPGKGIHAGEKFIVQILTGGVVAWWIYGVEEISQLWLPGNGTIDLGILMPIFIVFTVVAMANAVNISDGMDGLSSGMLIASFSGFFLLALFTQQEEIALLHATTIGSLLAYLYFNIKPARIQMGDVGSLALGTLIATTAFLQGQVLLLPIIGFTFVAIIGSSLVQSLYRMSFARRLLYMAPLHLHFQIVGWSEEKIVMRFWLAATFFMVLGIWLGVQ